MFRLLLTVGLGCIIVSKAVGQSWERTTLDFSPRIVHSMAAINDSIFIAGGRVLSGGQTNEVLIISKESSQKEIAPFDKRDGHTLVVGNANELMLFGGNTSSGPTNDLWTFKNDKWTQVQVEGARPAPRWGHAAIFYDNKLWVFGGKAIGKGVFHNDLWTWDGIKWEQIYSHNAPSGRYGAQLGHFDGNLILYGGRNHSGDWFTETWIWENDWKKATADLSTTPKASVGFVLITTPEGIFLIGGILKGDQYNEMWKWNGRWTYLSEVNFLFDFSAGCYSPKSNSLLVTGSSDGIFQLCRYSLKQ